ncbi:unnamed protein product [Gulo gulo]|uniref:Uncharacterized protein n=1 Tax=Gulo gulo TaxID=48420 RepID=A0A9X9MAH9_GULGU|nr:unnamed protein product [Gulo gulo]
MTQNFPFPAPSLHPALGLEAVILSPYWALICADSPLLLPKTVETMPALWPLPWGQGVGLWVPLPVGCWLKGQSCSLVRARGLQHPHSVTERRRVGWGGVSLSQLTGGKEGRLTLKAGALGRRYIAFNAKGRSRKLQ